MLGYAPISPYVNTVDNHFHGYKMWGIGTGKMTARLFFALWPSADTATQISAWTEDAHALVGGRRMRADTLHLTLAFLGTTAQDRIDALVSAVQTWPAVQLEQVVLQRFGRFLGPKVVWAGPAAGHTPHTQWLNELHDTLWQRLEALGWPRPDTVFRPHVSLLRKAGEGDVNLLQRPELRWTPERCVLVASTPLEGKSSYQVLAQLPAIQGQ